MAFNRQWGMSGMGRGMIILLGVCAILAGCSSESVTNQDQKNEANRVNQGSVEQMAEQEQFDQGHAGWKLVWSDEFDGERIDEQKWTYDIGNGFTDGNGIYISGWGNSELQYYTSRDENVHVSDGALRITAIKESFEGHSYTSTRVKTKGLFSQTYGRFEIRARLPVGRGLWPAIWMLPEESEYGGWAASGEIDIMEAKGSLPDQTSGAIHYGGVWPNNTYTAAEQQLPSGELISDYHVYALEWEREEIRWYVDDVLFQTAKDWHSVNAEGERLPYPAPFDKPFHLLINLAIGGHFDGNPDDDTAFPAVMEVDYVRVYEKE